MWFTNKLLKINACFRRKNVKISARSLRSLAKTTITNIVKECGDNNYTNSIVMKIMITNTSARPMCKASTLIFCRFIWYPPPPIPKSWLRHWWAPDRKKNVSPPLGLCPPPPPPPIQSCFRRACRKASSFCDFWKITFCYFTAFYTPFLLISNVCFFEMCWVISTISFAQ